MYGYTADIATDPLWARIEDTFGEDTELAADMVYATVKGFQGDKLGTDSVSLTVRHTYMISVSPIDEVFSYSRIGCFPEKQGSALIFILEPFCGTISLKEIGLSFSNPIG